MYHVICCSLLAIILSSSAQGRYVRSGNHNELIFNISGIVDMDVCNDKHVEKLEYCISQLNEGIMDFGNFGKTFEVHCCLYAKFRYCLTEEIFCGRNVKTIMRTLMRIEQNIIEKNDEHHCLRQMYPSIECSLFFHQTACIVVMAAMLLGMGALCSVVVIKTHAKREMAPPPTATVTQGAELRQFSNCKSGIGNLLSVPVKR
ncbi:hypothetical protein HDE_01745 [Halotydeus destructor]|nr:hypothetical protein HDE_01745 [Halotydeus destructor]